MSHKLPSGAELVIQPAPWKDAKALFNAVNEELLLINVDSSMDIHNANMWKDFFCRTFSSKRIDVAIAKCIERCTYNGLKIDENTFEPIEARQDYVDVIISVAKENLSPFAKDLFAKFTEVIAATKNFRA